MHLWKPPRRSETPKWADEAEPERSNLRVTGSSLGVWDTDTGKLLKAWDEHAPAGVAFHPTRPVLAILERNGENTTRLGLWDFAAEVEKK